MEKIKRFFNESIQSEKGKDILIVIIIILVGLGSFGLGRLSKDNKNPGIKIEYPPEAIKQEASAISAISENKVSQNSLLKTTSVKSSQTTSNANVVTAEKKFFASSKGSKYYSLGCSAGKSLKQENRIYFATREEAEKAGYELSSSCR